jgi:hypothetical protein
VKAKAPEELPNGGLKVLAGHLEHGGQVVALGGEGEQSGPRLGGQVGQRPGRVPVVHPGQQRDRQGQEACQLHQFSHGRIRLASRTGSQPHEHEARLIARQRLQDQRDYRARQVGEMATARDQHQALIGAGQ